MNVCSYHLQEAGATPVQELAFALAIAIAVLDTVKESGEVPTRNSAMWSGASGSSSTPAALHHRNVQDARLCRSVGRDLRDRYGVTDAEVAALPLRRAGRFARPHRAAAREQRLSHPDRDAGGDAVEERRARAVQLPAWNEALGLPRPWDQQWSLRMQQILAYETDLLEFGDIFDGSTEIAGKVEELKARGAGGAGPHRCDGRRGRGRGDRLHEASSSNRNAAPPRGDRTRRADRRRRQPFHRDRALSAGRRREADHDNSGRGRARADRAA